MPVEVTDKYIRVRVRMPDEFKDGTMRTVWLSKPKGINSVQGKLKKPPEGQTGSMVVQSLLFVKDKWSRADAVAWAREHGYTPKEYEPDITEVDFEYIEKTFIEQIPIYLEDEEFGEEEESESKSGRASIAEVEHKAYVGELKEVDEKERTITAFISTEALDRQGDIMRASGAQLAAYKKNPVVLWAHNYATPPIGRNLWIKKVKDKPGLLAKTQFADTEFADEIFRLYQGKFLNAWSVGFMPLESKEIDEDSSPSRGRDIGKWELLEYSAVPVPANPEALQLAMQKGIIGETLAKQLGMEVEEWAEEDEEDSITLTINPPPGKEVELAINEVTQEEKEEESEQVKPKLTGEEIAAWKKQVRQAVIAGVREWKNYALGKVTQKEGDNKWKRKNQERKKKGLSNSQTPTPSPKKSQKVS